MKSTSNESYTIGLTLCTSIDFAFSPRFCFRIYSLALLSELADCIFRPACAFSFTVYEATNLRDSLRLQFLQTFRIAATRVLLAIRV